MHRIAHDDIYQDRRTERALCYDFPADEHLISGLYALQAYFYNRGANIEIPVVRVMNTAHWLASYMNATTCSGDQMEYDAMMYNSVGGDKQLMFISLVVLSSMLKRTEGVRAKACRSMLMEDRSEDFYEGVSLYEQWLEGCDKYYKSIDFQIALTDELDEYKSKLQLAQNEIKQLQDQLTMKEERQAPIIHVAGDYIDIHDNNHCNIYATEPKNERGDMEPIQKDEPQSALFSRITEHAYEKGVAPQVEEELRSASVSAPKLVKAINTNEALGYLDTKNLSATDLYNLLDDHYNLPFKLRTFQDYRSK